MSAAAGHRHSPVSAPYSAAAVIDIGSNSIKILVATRLADGSVSALRHHTIDSRISAGINQAAPRLGEPGMEAGLAAIQELLALAAGYEPAYIALVATSAIRDAVNGAEFCERVFRATGHRIRILSGEEEANLIGRGLTSDHELAGLRDFQVFDLGGGSLECLRFRDRRIERAISLRLGCVRLTERFIADPRAPLSPAEAGAIAAHVRAEVTTAFPDLATPGFDAIFAGGSVATIRAIRGIRDGVPLVNTTATVTATEMRALLARLAPMTLAECQRVPGLPPPRADVFRTALVTLVTLAECAGVETVYHTFNNLRWGVADELLPPVVR
ncbi:exopolyphosphatase [Opitutaceae bacterium TAV1]|nr:exopolyphosphatase [Opitutaceae bacterium TAV1]